MKTFEMNKMNKMSEESLKNQGVKLTKLLISHLIIALVYKI